MKLKDRNPQLKILIAIGGWNAGSWPFEQIISSQANMDLFAQNSVTFLRKWNFDGLGNLFLEDKKIFKLN